MIVPSIFCKPPSNKANIFKRDWSNFDQKNFILDYFSIDWNVALKLDEQNVDYSTESFLNKINSILSNYVPLLKNQKVQITVSVKTMNSSWFTEVIPVKINF